jgi:hypothetical protein
VIPLRTSHSSNDSTLANRISREKNQTKLAKLMNKVVVGQAQEFVWGMDDSQLTFVQRYMGTIPEREIVTAKQHQEAIEAARGHS